MAEKNSLKELMDYLEWLEEEKEKILDIMEKKIEDNDFDSIDAMGVVGRFDKIINNLDKRSG